MKNITNKTLGIIGIILMLLSYISGATDSNGYHMFVELSIISAIAYILFIIIASIRLWKNFKYLTVSFILFNILGISSLYFSLGPFLFIVLLISFILNITIIVKLFKKQNMVLKTILEAEVDSFKKNNSFRKMSDFLGTTLTVLIVIALVGGWIINVVKFFRLDFREPFKAEVIRGFGLAPTPLGSILGYISIKDGLTQTASFPSEYIQDKESLTQSFSFINDAFDLTSNAENIGSREEIKIKEYLNSGIIASQKVSDDFLNYLHPELKMYYRDKFIKGAELYFTGIQNAFGKDGVNNQMEGIKLSKEWSDWWGKNKDEIIKKVFIN